MCRRITESDDMRILKFTHSCVRLEADDGGTLVIDPGVWTEDEALVGADAVLVTHEHVVWRSSGSRCMPPPPRASMGST